MLYAPLWHGGGRLAMVREAGALGYVKFADYPTSTAAYLVREFGTLWVVALPAEEEDEGAIAVRTELGKEEWIVYRKAQLPKFNPSPGQKATRFEFEKTEGDSISLETLVEGAPPEIMSGVVTPMRSVLSPSRSEVRAEPPAEGQGRLDDLEMKMGRLMSLVEQQAADVRGLAMQMKPTAPPGTVPSLLDQPPVRSFGATEVADILDTEGPPPKLGKKLQNAPPKVSEPPQVPSNVDATVVAAAQLRVLEKMTQRLDRRAESDDGSDDDGYRNSRSREDGLEKLHRLERELNHRPKQIYTDFERRVGRELGMREGEHQGVENPGLKVARYFETRVPLKSTSKTAIRFAYAISEVYRRLALGEVEQARAQVALLAGAIEQYAIDHERWEAGWLMAHLPEPNFNLFPKDAPTSTTEYARSMDPARVRAAWKHFKEQAGMREIKKKNPQP